MNTASEALEARLMAHPVARRVAAGPRGLAFALHGFLDRRFDRRNGTETSGAVPVEELGVDADTQDAIWYEPMSTKIFDAIEAG